MGKISIKGETALKYLTHKDWGKLPIKTLARLMYSENAAVFKDVEDARSTLRYYTGQHGGLQKNKSTYKETQTEKGQAAMEYGVPNPFGLPDTDETEWEPFVLPKGATKILLLSDIHVPYHNIKALALAIEYGKKRGVNTVVFNGDTLDCYALSRYEKDPRKRKFSEELETCRQLLDVFKRELDCPMYFKLGNHEERFEAYMRIKAPELLGCADFTLDSLLRFGEKGITLIQDMRIIKAGQLNILHGHEFGRSVFSPVNPARGFYMRAKASVICGHNHQSSTHTESNLDGKVVTTWSTGCLCEMHPAYIPINKWNHGFAFVEVDPDTGEYEVENLTIINGKLR